MLERLPAHIDTALARRAANRIGGLQLAPLRRWGQMTGLHVDQATRRRKGSVLTEVRAAKPSTGWIVTEFVRKDTLKHEDLLAAKVRVRQELAPRGPAN